MLALGRSIAAVCVPGTVLALTGELGAGKTVFARGLARGLGITGRVPSPTYVIVQTLEGGRLPLWHGDLYRLSDPDELEQLGLVDVMYADGVVVLEWAGRAEDALPDDRLDIVILLEPGSEIRTVTLSSTGPLHQALRERLHG